MSTSSSRSVRRSVLKGALVLLALPFVGWLLLPWPLPLRWFDPGTTAYMEYRVEQAAAQSESLELKRSWIPLDSVSPQLVRAVLVAEDDRFREHRGVDWDALAEETGYRGAIPPDLFDPDDRMELLAAIRRVRDDREGVRGRSTLTQQLARNLYLSPERAFTRKAQELLLARRLETFLSKDRILELYLNAAELGPGIFGVEAASRAYFDRSASAVTQTQAAALAATLPHPLTSNPAHNPARMSWRQELILTRLRGGERPIPVPDPVEVRAPELPTPSIPEPEPSPDTLRPDTVHPDTLSQDTIPSDTVRGGDQPGSSPWDLQR